MKRSSVHLIIASLAILAMAFLPAIAAAQGVMFIKDDKVGIGIDTPTTPLHVFSDGNAAFLFQSGAVKFNFKVNGQGNFLLSKVGSSGTELTVTAADQNNTLLVGGDVKADAFNVASSRALKEGFTSLDNGEILAKVVDLPISQWSYKRDKYSTPHIGPMAEDFHAIFGAGRGGEEAISLADASGIALAAIQGLHEKVQDRDQIIEQLLGRVEQLEARLAK